MMKYSISSIFDIPCSAVRYSLLILPGNLFVIQYTVKLIRNFNLVLMGQRLVWGILINTFLLVSDLIEQPSIVFHSYRHYFRLVKVLGGDDG